MATISHYVPIIAFGPKLPGWGSWDWIGADLCHFLDRTYRTIAFVGAEIPKCDVCVVVKHPLPAELLAELTDSAAVIYCPVDCFGSAFEIDGYGAALRQCARIVIHSERLRKYFAPYAPVEFIDHHCKFVAPLRDVYHDQGEILWVGVRSNLPALIDWVNYHQQPGRLRVLTNLEDPAHPPTATDLGFRHGRDVIIEQWSPATHLQRMVECRAALDIKGNDFRSRHKPPAKAIDFVASGVPLAINSESAPADHLARMGFDLASPLDANRWLSLEYWEETCRFGAALRELLSLERIGRRWRRLIDEVLAVRFAR
jgi:hypothetical protein